MISCTRAESRLESGDFTDSTSQRAVDFLQAFSPDPSATVAVDYSFAKRRLHSAHRSGVCGL